jgi:hypothetical protein
MMLFSNEEWRMKSEDDTLLVSENHMLAVDITMFLHNHLLLKLKGCLPYTFKRFDRKRSAISIFLLSLDIGI